MPPKQPYRHKENRGSMFENDRKEKETQPDMTGSIDVAGTVYWINGWKDITDAGKKRLSLSVHLQEPTNEHNNDRRPPQRQAGRQRSTW